MIEKIKKIVGGHANPYYIILIFLVLAVLDVLGISMVPLLIEAVITEKSDSIGLEWLSIFLPGGHDVNLMWFLSFVVVVLFSIKSVVFIISNYLIYRFSYSVMHQNRVELISLLLGSHYQGIINKSSADFINLLQLHINQSVSNYLVPSLKLASDVLVAVLILTYLLVIHTKITLILLAITAILSFSYLKKFRKSLYFYGKNSYIYNHAMIDLAKSIRTGFVDIIVNGGVSYFKRLFSENSFKFSYVQIRSATVRVIPRPLFEWVTILFVILLVLLNSESENKTVLITLLTTFGMAAIRLLPAVTSIIASLTSMKSSEAAVEKYFSERSMLIKESSNTDKFYDLSKKTPISNVSTLSVENVSFYHEKGNELLNSISFNLQKGDAIGIIGPSGSGKSTLLSIIIGLLKPIKGHVCLDNINVLELGVSDHFAYVPQFPFISNDTLLNNIIYPGGNKDIAHVKKLMESVGLSDLVSGKVADLNDIVGEKGISLSGGQAQRIALVRAILQDKDVLIIDEGTSALDDESSKRVLQILKKLKEDKIIIIVSHREEILGMCNKIFNLGNGISYDR